MKKDVKRTLLFLFICIAMLCVLPFGASALRDGVFEYDIIGNSCEIISCSKTASGDLVVPDTIDGKVVISVGERAFYDLDSISSVTLPTTVESIGSEAFADCSNLLSLVMPDSVSYMGNSVFDDCINLRTVVLSENITSLPAGTFYNCIRLSNLQVSPSTFSFGENAFYDCLSLTYFVFPETTKVISDSCFYGCSSLSSVYIPSNINVIDTEAFAECTALKKVYFGGSSEVTEDFSVASGNSLLMNSDWIFNHNHTESESLTVIESTCEKEGYTESLCVCGFLNAADYIPAKGHDLSVFDTVKEPDCKNKGIARLRCSRCSFYEEMSLPTVAHKIVVDEAVAADCFAEGKTKGSHCYVCDEIIVKQEVVPALGHDYSRKIYDEAHLVSAPTYSKTALYRYSCTRCSAVSGETFPGDKLKLGKPSEFVSTSTSDSITLAWSEVKDADFYGLYFMNSAGKWKLYRKVEGNSYKIYSLPSGTTYTFGVRAYVYEDGMNIASPTYVTLREATRPLKPEKVVANQNETAIKLTWTASKGATGYRVYGYNAKIKSWVIVKSSTKACNTIVSNLGTGVSYKFAVRPYIDTGSKIVWSEDYITLVTSTKPVAPVLKATSLKGAVRFEWDKVIGADGYIIYGSTKSNSGYVRLCVTKNLTYTKSGLASGQTYYFRAYSVKTVENGYVYSYAGDVKPAKTR